MTKQHTPNTTGLRDGPVGEGRASKDTATPGGDAPHTLNGDDWYLEPINVDRHIDYAVYIPGGPQVATVHCCDDNDIMARRHGHVIAAAPKLLDRLEASTKAMIAERDAFYDTATNQHGEYTDPGDRHQVAEMDAEIDANRAALAKARGETA